MQVVFGYLLHIKQTSIFQNPFQNFLISHFIIERQQQWYGISCLIPSLEEVIKLYPRPNIEEVQYIYMNKILLIMNMYLRSYFVVSQTKPEMFQRFFFSSLLGFFFFIFCSSLAFVSTGMTNYIKNVDVSTCCQLAR